MLSLCQVESKEYTPRSHIHSPLCTFWALLRLKIVHLCVFIINKGVGGGRGTAQEPAVYRHADGCTDTHREQFADYQLTPRATTKI